MVLLVALAGAWSIPPVEAQRLLLVGFTEEEERYLEAHGPIRVVINRFEPWTLNDSTGQPAGVTWDFLRLMRVKTGLEFVVIETRGVNASLEVVSRREGDLIPALAKTPERERALTFSAPYGEQRVQLWGPPSASTLLRTDLAGARVATTRAGAQAALLVERYPAAEPVYVDNVSASVAAVRNGSADAILGPQPSIANIARTEGYADLVPLGAVLAVQPLHMATSRQEPTLAHIIDKALAAVDADERTAIFVKWTGLDLSPGIVQAPTVALRTVAVGGLVLVALAGAIGIPTWIALLRRRVGDRTRELRAREVELAAANVGLESSVASRTASLAGANADFEEFTYSMTHDLKTPVRSIRSFTDQLLKHERERLSERGGADLERVHAAALRLSRLLDDLLDLGRVTRMEMVDEDVDVTALARSLAAELAPAFPGHQVDFDVDRDVRVRADPRLVRTVLLNLLENAWKFTRGLPAPRVRLEHAPAEGGFVAIEVHDNGVGFDPRFASKLFQPFERLHSDPMYPGSGIGLATVRRIVSRYGGACSGEGTPGGGASFRVTLPAPAEARLGTTPMDVRH